MLLASVFILLSLFAQPQETTSLADQALEQANYYLEQIQNANNSEIHVWALARLCENEHKPKILEYINQKSKEVEEFRDLQDPFCSDTSFGDRLAKLSTHLGTSNLLLAALLKTSDPDRQQTVLSNFESRFEIQNQQGVDFKSLISRVIAKDSIDTHILPNDRFLFAHYLLLFSNQAISNNIITKHYYQKIANDWYQQDLKFNPQSLESSLALISLLRALYLTNQYSKAQHLHADLTQERLFPISDIKANIYQFWAYTMYTLGLYDKGLEILREFSIPLTKFLGYEQKELSLLEKQGIYLYRIGKIFEAQKIYQTVLDRAQKEEIEVNRSSLYTNLSLTHLKSGHFDQYLNIQFRALELAKSQNNYPHQYKILRNLHIYYRQNENQEAALTYIKRAKKLAQEYSETDDLASIYTSLGVFLPRYEIEPRFSQCLL
ncbi:MAG: hypothetical protein U5K69_01870 [Balneolaceae bacterium]|nr:hypothetical protein [Balneolaceae bacterium]